MKPALFLLSAACLTMPLAAQDHANHAAPAAPAAAPATAAKFSLDTPVETLMADAKGKAAVDAVLPGIEAHPSYEMAKAMSFNQLAAMAPTLLTPEVLGKLKTNLDAIK
ncbi:hypothetical protein ACFSC3_03465 [Sphingomonas floccifaciens]|uniref:Uncharacterized protein n=1 Tax=Sphingomonas floccifaciens TaxID=1844115 RepID=A0ABW4NAX0_9SPHN